MRAYTSAFIAILSLLLTTIGSNAAEEATPASANVSESSELQGAPRTFGGPGTSLAGAALAQRLDALEARLSQLENDAKTRDDGIATMLSAIQANQRTIENLAQNVNEHSGLIQSNQTSIASTNRTVNENNLKLRDTVKQNSQGGYYLDLLGNSQDPEFVTDFRQAVNLSRVTTQGMLKIVNRGPERPIYVNGSQWRALGYQESFVWVPLGNVNVSEQAGVAPPVRGGRYWTKNEKGVWEIEYDFDDPWRWQVIYDFENR